MNISHAQKLNELRARLKAEGVDGFIVPRADEYQGESVPPCAERLKWLTGFTGSAGFAVVLADRAAVMSDGRYTIQLKQQVDPALFETGDSTKTSAAVWLSEHAPDAVIGYDPKLHTVREVKALAEKGVKLKPLAVNPLDAVWQDRPAPPSAAVEAFPLKFAGLSAQGKLDRVAAVLTHKKLDAAVITLPDSIAWLLNVRSADIPHTPVALSTAIARADGTLDWFIDEQRVPAAIRESFGNRVALAPPGELEQRLSEMKGKKVLLDGRHGAAWFRDLLDKAGAEIADDKDPVIPLKARKNEAEQAAMRAAHVRDGVAVTKLLKWLDDEAGKGELSELDAEAKLDAFRRAAPEHKGASFDTIAGYGPNGAIIHYRATEKTNRAIKPGSLLLVDSGAQYADGTTDITRTVAIGRPTPAMREHYTLVLKGHLALSMARFPHGTTGAQLDALARSPLWQRNLDYVHGTGHGVGCHLSVHEEAAGISPRGAEPVEPGMILSNEPGYYLEGAYGIRIENLVLAKEDGICAATGKAMIRFETLTLAPYDGGLIVPEMLTAGETLWLAEYHKRVFTELSPYLDQATRDWLKAEPAL